MNIKALYKQHIIYTRILFIIITIALLTTVLTPVNLYGLVLLDSPNNHNSDQAFQEGFRLSWFIFRPGCIKASSTNYLVDGTLGEPFIGISQSQNFFLRIGHFYSTQITTAVEEHEMNVNFIPDTYDLSQNYPNPFNSTTKLMYQIPKPGAISIKIFNVLGKKIITLVDEHKDPGCYLISWDGTDTSGDNVTSGIYIVKFMSKSLVGEEFCKTRFIVLIR